MDEEDLLKKKSKKNNNHEKKKLVLENSGEIENLLSYIKQEEKKEELPKVEIPVIKAYELLQEMSFNEDDMDVVPKRKQSKLKTFFTKKSYKYGIGFAVFMFVLLGASYSYFNYTKVDSRQADISSGTVYVKLVENASSISLSKMYPRTNEEARSRNDNYFDFTIKGKNTSDIKSLLYTISINNGSDVSGKTRINPKYIKLDLQEKVNNNYNYIQEAVSLDSYAFTGVISTGTTSEITREYRLRLWVSDELIISDTEPNAAYTQSQFANLYANFNISVDSEDKNVAYSMFSKDANAEALIDFSEKSSSTNGEGLYVLLGTSNDTFPIYYYRGAVNNNNVVFGDYCWHIVRTTDTGGIKMIYNGDVSTVESNGTISYNCGITRPIQNKISSETALSNGSYYYADDYEIVSNVGNYVTYRLKSKNNPITQVTVTTSNASTVIETIASNYPYTCRSTTENGTCTDLYKVDGYISGTSARTYESINISIIGTNKYNQNHESMADVGYMSNVRYEYNTATAAQNSIFGKSVEWDGSNYLVIENVSGEPSTNTTFDNQHHYTCGTIGETTCSTVRFYYGSNYLELINGDTIQDALYKMTGNGTDDVKLKNSDYKLNVNDSLIKTLIETWFAENLTNNINTSRPNYQKYLEDTAFCNDRSFKTVEGNTSYATFLNSNFNPNGGDLTKNINFGTSNRVRNNWYSTTNVPSLTCPNEIDRFSVGNTRAHLNYPVGMLTADELVLAGANHDGWTNSNYYLYGGIDYFTMSPYSYSNYDSIVYENFKGLQLQYTYVNSTAGIRPVVSLKLGIEFETGGDGTPTNPYVVKYN